MASERQLQAFGATVNLVRKLDVRLKPTLENRFDSQFVCLDDAIKRRKKLGLQT